MSIVTLTTDFGIGDYAGGLLHGVVLSIAPDTQVVDLTHAIPRHDIAAGALTLDRALPYFPPGTVHVVVVDPGVGTQRRPLAAQLGDQFFVGPDNGLVTYAYQRLNRSSIPCRFCHLTQPSYWLEFAQSHLPWAGHLHTRGCPSFEGGHHRKVRYTH